MPAQNTAQPDAQVNTVLKELDRFAATMAESVNDPHIMPEFDAGYALAAKHLADKLTRLREEVDA